MKKRGISIISLSVMVVVMLIILSVVSVSLTYSITNAKKMAFAEELYNLQSIVDEYIKKEGVLPKVQESITITPSDITQFESENFVNGTLTLDVLDIKQLDIKNTKCGNKTIGSNEPEKAKDVYAVSATTGRVYYIAGFKSGDKTYYTLTEELRQMVEKEQNITIGEKTITFTPSKIGWANEGVQVTAFVPAEFTSPSITIDNANIAYTESSNADGITYVVNNDKKLENYTITINYTKNGVAQTITYSTKLDNVAPVISKDSTIANTETHIKGLKATDTQSGIKYFKYAEGAIDAADVKTYMNIYGKNLKNGSIKFSNKVIYTLYAEDKAGNYSVMYINEAGELVPSIKTIPMLAAGASWYTQALTSKPSMSYVKSLNFVDTFDSTGKTILYQWDASTECTDSNDNEGPITVYMERDSSDSSKYNITIAGNGSGSILANPDSTGAFSYGGSFSQLSGVTGLQLLDTSNVTNMSYMFEGCFNLTDLDLSNFDTTMVNNMSNMFDGCSNLTQLDLSNFDTHGVSDMSYMFAWCGKLTNIKFGDNFTTTNTSNMSQMFRNLGYLSDSYATLDLSNFDTSNVTDMSYMFEGTKLEILDLRSFKTSSITNMTWMCYGCDVTTFIFGKDFEIGTGNKIFYDSGNYGVVDTTVYGASNTVKAYNWSGDNRNVTFVDELP